MFQAMLGFYSILSIITAYMILSYDDWSALKALKARIAARRLKRLKTGQLIFLTSIVRYTEDI